MLEQYSKNIGTLITTIEQYNLLNKTIAVIGCGGQGGYILEFLTRLGLKKIIFFDGDIFTTSNLNRQLYCNSETLNQNKAKTLYEQLIKINNNIELEYYEHFFCKDDIPLLTTVNLIINCANKYTYDTFYSLGQFCQINKIPILFSSLGRTATKIYIYNYTENFQNFLDLFDLVDIAKEQLIQQPYISQPAYACALTAAITCDIAVKILLNKKILIQQYSFNQE